MLSYHGIKIQSTKTAIACLFSMALLSLWPSLGSGTPALPALPQATIDTTYSPPTTGNTITVNAGGNFQTALNNANQVRRLPEISHCLLKRLGQVGYTSCQAIIPAFRLRGTA